MSHTNNKSRLARALVGLFLVIEAMPSDSAPRTETRTYYPDTGLLHTIDGPRTDVADSTEYVYYTTGPHIGLVETITNALGHVTTYTDYDAAGRVKSVTDPNGIVTNITHHPRGWLKSREVAGALTQFSYDKVGNLDVITLPTGSTLDYDYDAANRLSRITDTSGNYIEYRYEIVDDVNSQGQPVKAERRIEEIYAFSDTAGTQLRRTTVRVYNSLRQLKTILGQSQRTVAEYSYDDNGNEEDAWDGKQNKTTSHYDALDRLERQVDPLFNETKYDYDSQDRITSVTDPNGGITTYFYNGHGDLKWQDSPDSGRTDFDVYDEAGNLKQKTDARGVATTYTYDALNRLRNVSYPTNPSLNVTFNYDEPGVGPRKGHLTSMVDASGTTAYTYDDRGNLSSKTHNSQTIKYTYDLSDNLSSITYPSGFLVAYFRGADDQVTRVTLTDDQRTKTLAKEIAYEPFGPLKSLAYGNGLTLSRVLDQEYRLESQVVMDAPNATTLLDTTYLYDGASNIEDWLNNLDVSKHQHFEYDSLNRLDLAQGNLGDFDYEYDAVGNRNYLIANSTTIDYGYLLNSNRLTSVDGNDVSTDEAGNITSSPRGIFTYSEANRLKSFSGNGHNASYTYNGLGQRTRKSGSIGTTDFYYDEQGQLLAELDGSGSILREYVYLDGQPLALVKPNWQLLNNKFELTSVTDTGTVTLNLDLSKHIFHFVGVNGGQVYLDLTYNEWTSTTVGDTTTIYFKEKDTGLVRGAVRIVDTSTAEVPDTAEAVIQVKLTNASGVEEWYSFTMTGEQKRGWVAQRHYLHTDHLGAVIKATDQEKAVAWSADRKPFGELTITTEAIENPLRFPGQYYDEESGLHYNYFRYYDPATGRYITSDPIGLEGGLNTYGYVGGNPIRFRDLKGLYFDPNIDFSYPEDYLNDLFGYYLGPPDAFLEAFATEVLNSLTCTAHCIALGEVQGAAAKKGLQLAAEKVAHQGVQRILKEGLHYFKAGSGAFAPVGAFKCLLECTEDSACLMRPNSG